MKILWTELNGSISSKFKKIEKATKIRKEKCCLIKFLFIMLGVFDDRQLTDKRSPLASKRGPEVSFDGEVVASVAFFSCNRD